MISRIFSCKFLHIQIASVSWHRFFTQNFSNCCMHKYDPSISRIFQSNFWRNFSILSHCAPHTAPVPSTYFVSFAIRFVRKQASSIALRRVPPWPRKLRPLAFRDTYSHMATTIPLTVCAMAVVHKDAL